MPELPEVETVCRALKPILEGQAFEKIDCMRPNLRYPLPDLHTSLQLKPIQAVRRRAKYILIDFTHGLTLLWHLGMSGRVRIDSALEAKSHDLKPHDHVIFITSHHQRIIFHDPRRFGFLLVKPTEHLESHRPFDTLGFEPLNPLSGLAVKFHEALQQRAVSIKSALLNQKIMAGVGNIYASEALWQAKISPFRLTNTLSFEETEALLIEIQDVLTRAIEAGGSTLRDHYQPDGTKGYFQHSFKVYGRENKLCKHCCITPLTKVNQQGRATYYCQKCQQ